MSAARHRCVRCLPLLVFFSFVLLPPPGGPPNGAAAPGELAPATENPRVVDARALPVTLQPQAQLRKIERGVFVRPSDDEKVRYREFQRRLAAAREPYSTATTAPTGPAKAPQSVSGTASIATRPIIQDFAGIGDTGYYPADVDIAVGYNVTIQVVNSSFRFVDKCGAIITEQTFASFIGDYTSSFYHPQVEYDNATGRWVIAVLARDDVSQTCRVYFMSPISGDPLGFWRIASHDLHNGTPSTWSESLSLVVGPAAFYFAVNRWTWAPAVSFEGNFFGYFNKADFYAGNTATGWTWSNLVNADATKCYAPRVVRMHTWPGSQWIINTAPGGGSFLTLWKHTGAPSAGTMTSYNVPVGYYSPVPDLIQPDASTVDLGDCRIHSAVVNGDTLLAAQTMGMNFSEVDDRAAIVFNEILLSTRGVFVDSYFGRSGQYYAYPCLEVDDQGRGVVACLHGGPSDYMSLKYTAYSNNYIDDFGFVTVGAGATNYSHTGSPPYRWGGSYAVSRDPADGRTLWVSGPYAAAGPAWATHIASTSFEAHGVLGVTPGDPLVSSGLADGPFYPPYHDYEIANTGASATTWKVTGLEWWSSPSKYVGTVAPGGVDTLRITVFPGGLLPPGEHVDDFAIEDCFTGTAYPRSIHLLIGEEGACAGNALFLAPNPMPTSWSGSNEERGVYITARQDFELCAVGMMADLEVPQEVTVNVYAADGTVRGSVLGTTTFAAVQGGGRFHYVPINFLLEACRDYEIAFSWAASNGWPGWDERTLDEPFDIGPIRVNDGSFAGAASNFVLPYFSLIGGGPGCDRFVGLEPPELPFGTCTDPETDRGLYVTAFQTLTTCAIGIEADLPPEAPITAKVYAAGGVSRGDLIAVGAAISEGSGMHMRMIPVSVVLDEGSEYDISIEFPGGIQRASIDESSVTFPYQVEDALRVREGESGGNAAADSLAHLYLQWTPGAGGAPFDLSMPAGPHPPQHCTNAPSTVQGMYVTSLVEQNVYALGWKANMPEGAEIVARIYEAAGNTRGALIAEGIVHSSGPGMRWHDVPLIASLAAGDDYDFEIVVTNPIEWCLWNDESALPYQAYGVVEVRASESNGDAAIPGLIELRMHACDAVLTSVSDEPARPPAFFLSAPFPNPATQRSTIRFGLDSPGAVTIAVYDVAGRRVATLLARTERPAGEGTVALDTAQLSSGVYFVRLETETRMVSRKITVVR